MPPAPAKLLPASRAGRTRVIITGRPAAPTPIVPGRVSGYLIVGNKSEPEGGSHDRQGEDRGTGLRNDGGLGESRAPSSTGIAPGAAEDRADRPRPGGRRRCVPGPGPLPLDRSEERRV